MNELFDAIKNNNIKKAEKLINSGININEQNETGLTALMSASAYGYIKIVQILIDVGAKVNLRDEMGNTALIYATFYRWSEGVKLLLGSIANIHIERVDDSIAIKIIKMLIGAGAYIHQKNAYNSTALDYAKELNHQEIIELLTFESFRNSHTQANDETKWYGQI